MKVRNSFKGLDLIDRVPDELWTEVCDIVQETGIKTIPKKKKCKKAKWLSEEALDYHDIEWFALETNTDHSVVFEIASKHCILTLLLTMIATPLPHREKIFASLFPTPTHYMCLIQSTSDPQDPYPNPCTMGIKVD